MVEDHGDYALGFGELRFWRCLLFYRASFVRIL